MMIAVTKRSVFMCTLATTPTSAEVVVVVEKHGKKEYKKSKRQFKKKSYMPVCQVGDSKEIVFTLSHTHEPRIFPFIFASVSHYYYYYIHKLRV